VSVRLLLMFLREGGIMPLFLLIWRLDSVNCGKFLFRYWLRVGIADRASIVGNVSNFADFSYFNSKL